MDSSIVRLWPDDYLMLRAERIAMADNSGLLSRMGFVIVWEAYSRGLIVSIDSIHSAYDLFPDEVVFRPTTELVAPPA